jgi:hypothetical protein
MPSILAMRASMDKPRTLASLALRSVTSFRGTVFLRDAPLPLKVAAGGGGGCAGVGRLRFWRASAAVWSSE